MAFMKHAALALLLASIACGGDSDDTMMEDEPMDGDGMVSPSERPGPAGCYIGAQQMCDCALTEAQCTGGGMLWVENGCMSCAR
jgi:hypothetical protein